MTDKEILNFLTKELNFSINEAAELLIKMNRKENDGSTYVRDLVVNKAEMNNHWSARKVGAKWNKQ